MKAAKGILLIGMFTLPGSSISAQPFKYIGADKCRPCHNRPASGEQYKKWLKDPHSQALLTLSNQASLDYAKKNNITVPSKDAGCLKCHSTYDAIGENLRGEIMANEGVSCESCHGPGSSYKAIPVMRSHEQSLTMGLIVPDEQLCLTCHNKNSPFFKEFNYEAALVKIAHPNLTKGLH